MKLSQQAIDALLHIIAGFDRERGVPHNYFDLERTLKNVEIEIKNDNIYVVPLQKRNK